MRSWWLLFVFISVGLQASPNDGLETKRITASRVLKAPKIDGILSDESWVGAMTISDFVQLNPTEGEKPTQKTTVKILYDDQAIYIGAFMSDTSPDSIQTELGERDDEDLNADVFHFRIDPYNTHQDAYMFAVSASGVQLDERYSDESYNAVWESKVLITDKGWVAEMKIPYSAIRFPNSEVQTWSVQFTRYIRRNDEFIQWALTPKGKPTPQNYWGEINGISGIKSPIRLSITPYLSTYWERSPLSDSDGILQTGNTYSYNAGTDLKYGIDDRFTLDLTLLPDFGQVESDDKVKNLSYNEVTYDENRPFFNEGVDLFSRMGMFYSRRIGQTPSGSEDVEAGEGEYIVANPAQSNLINATKISGRGNSGLGLGFFNAMTNTTYATVSDSSGNERKIMTEPLTNYNVMVVDKQFKNNANFFVINTNVMRSGSFEDANVTGSGFRLFNKKKTINVWADGAFSQGFASPDSSGSNNSQGFKYSIGIRKATGAFRIGFDHSVINDTYGATGMGYWTTTNLVKENLFMDYSLFNPWKIFRRARMGADINYTANYLTGQRGEFRLNMNGSTTFHNLYNLWAGLGIAPFGLNDFYEPRIYGKFFDKPASFYFYYGGRTDRRKKFVLQIGGHRGMWLATYNQKGKYGVGFEIEVEYRVNNKLSFEFEYEPSIDYYQIGFADLISDDSIVFAGRVIESFTNRFSAKYTLSNNMWITLDSRHYWSTGKNKDLFLLQDDGSLDPTTGNAGVYNFSFNAFTIDLVYTWWFAPGSTLSVVYKNILENEDGKIINKYGQNFSEMLNAPQVNSISLKALYYLDYLYLKKKNRLEGRH